MLYRWCGLVLLILLMPFSSLSYGSELPDFRFGGQFHMNLFYSDDGLNDLNLPERDASARFGVLNRSAKILFFSQLREDLRLTVRYNMLSNQLEYGFLSYQFNEELNITIGRNKERLYGWHRRVTGSLHPIVAPLLSLRPIDYVDGFHLTYQFGRHQFLVQIAEDVFECPIVACDGWNRIDADGQRIQKQPAILTEWIGSYGAFQPLLQYTSYDQGHSASWAVGMRYQTSRTDIHADYIVDRRVNKGLEDSEVRKEENTIAGWVIHGRLVSGQFLPFFHLSSFEVDQFQMPGAVARKMNSRYARFDDNNFTWGLGAGYNLMGPLLEPYVMLSSRSGEFVDPQDASQAKTLAEMRVTFGVTSEF